jgi:hypothetical protein
LWAPSFIAFAFALACAACDSGEEVTPESTFPAEVPESRNLVGRVLAGTEPVAGALVRVDVSPGFASDAKLNASTDPATTGLLTRTDTTNAGGSYRFGFAPISRDLSIRAGSELLVYRALSVRAFDVSLGVEATPSGYMAGVVPSTDPPTKPGNAVAYFVSGPDARTLSGGSGTREVRFRRFESTVTLHAVEYVASLGLAAAVAEGHVDVLVRDGVLVTPVVPMTLVPTTLKVTFDATPPPGFTLEPLEVLIDLGLRTSAAPVTRIAPGVPLDLAIVTGARYTVRAHATQADGQVSDSGRFLFNAYLGKIPLTLPGPISAEAPIDDDAIATGKASNTVGPTPLDVGGELSARLGEGVVEHVLTPASGEGTVIRVVTSSRTTVVPDATTLGLPAPKGRYLWTFQHFPTFPRPDFLAGEDGRISAPTWTSTARVLVLR